MKKLLSAVLLFFPLLAAAELIVITNGVPLNEDDVRAVYLGEKQFVNGTKVTVIDNVPLKGELASRLGMSQQQYETAWVKKKFRDGTTPPLSRFSDDEVINYVRDHPGSVGYIRKDIKVLQIRSMRF